MAKKKPEPELDNETPRLYALVFRSDYQGPAEKLVRLPHGAVKRMNLLEAGGKKPKRNAGDDAVAGLAQFSTRAAIPPDYPYFEWELSPLEAAEYVKAGFEARELAGSNLPEA